MKAWRLEAIAHAHSGHPELQWKARFVRGQSIVASRPELTIPGELPTFEESMRRKSS